MRPTPESSTQEVLAGLVERVTFHNAENGFCVLRAKTRGHRDLVTVVGHAASSQPANATRRLAAITAIDVVSYSRLMGEDEAGKKRRRP